MSRLVFLVVSLALVLPCGAMAQRAGQSAAISVGTVAKVETIDLRSKDAPAGALVGGMLAYHTSSSKSSSSTKWGRAAVGAVAGGAIARAREGDLTGMLYTIEVGGGRTIQVVSDQTEIRKGDCVIVEEINGQANVRRADPTACEPESEAVMADADVQEELQEEAAECLAAKEEMLAAETEKAFELAQRKMDIFCND